MLARPLNEGESIKGVYKTTTLRNGIRIITKELKDAKTVNVTASFAAGSKYSPPGKEGLAHLLEHMLTNGSPKYPGRTTVRKRIAEAGGSNNASTDREYAKYTLKILAESLEVGADIEFSLIKEPLLTEDYLTKEKKIINEEINMREDNLGVKLVDLLMKNISLDHPFVAPLGGFKESLKNIELGDVEQFYKTFYAADNLIIAAAGNLQHENFISLVERYFGDMPAVSRPRYKPLIYQPQGPKASVLPDDSNQMLLRLYFPVKPANFSERMRVAFLSRLLHVRIFDRLREKEKLAYDASAGAYHYDDLSLFEIDGGFRLDAAQEAVSHIVDELNKVKKIEIEEEEFLRIKKTWKTGLLFRFENHGYWVDFALYSLHLKEPLELEDNVAEIERIKPEEIQKLARELFVPERAHLAVVHKEKKPEEFEDLLRNGLR